MKRQFTAVYKKTGKWYSGWIEEIPGVNTQGKTLKETRENLKEALELIIETNKLLQEAPSRRERYRKEIIEVSFSWREKNSSSTLRSIAALSFVREESIQSIQYAS